MNDLDVIGQRVLDYYSIEDPVYSGLLRWRIETCKKWKEQFNLHPKDILEVGTGSFPFTIFIGDKETRFLGIEGTESFANDARRDAATWFTNSEVIHRFWTPETVSELKLEEKFDFIGGFQVYEHIAKEEKFLEALTKCLKPGGYCLIETVNKQVTPYFEKVLGFTPTGGADYDRSAHINEPGFHELFEDFRANGYEILDFQDYYLTTLLWQDKTLDKETHQALYQILHKAASEFPFYSYIQSWLARKK